MCVTNAPERRNNTKQQQAASQIQQLRVFISSRTQRETIKRKEKSLTCSRPVEQLTVMWVMWVMWVVSGGDIRGFNNSTLICRYSQQRITEDYYRSVSAARHRSRAVESSLPSCTMEIVIFNFDIMFLSERQQRRRLLNNTDIRPSV